MAMELFIEERIGAQGGAFYIRSPFDLSGLDVPSLGPYRDRRSATRASEQIVAAVTGASA
jgi:hypothetical protein